MRQYGSKIKAFTYVPLQVGCDGFKGSMSDLKYATQRSSDGNFAQENNTRSAGSPTESQS